MLPAVMAVNCRANPDIVVYDMCCSDQSDRTKAACCSANVESNSHSSIIDDKCVAEIG